MVRGARLGILDRKYLGPAGHAWQAMKEKVSHDGLVFDVSTGTPPGDFDHYQNIARGVETYGTGFFLQLGAEMSRLATMPYELTEFMTAGRVPHRVGAGHYLGGPTYGAYATRDGDIVIEGDLRLIAEALGCQALLADERFAPPDLPQDPDALADHREEIRGHFEACLADRHRDEVLKDLNAAGVWCMPVLTVPETCEHPQLAENEMLTSYEDPEIGTVKTVATPFELSRTPGGPHSHPPALGEHNDEVLSRRLNLTSDEIERLREERVVT